MSDWPDTPSEWFRKIENMPSWTTERSVEAALAHAEEFRIKGIIPPERTKFDLVDEFVLLADEILRLREERHSLADCIAHVANIEKLEQRHIATP